MKIGVSVLPHEFYSEICCQPEPQCIEFTLDNILGQSASAEAYRKFLHETKHPVLGHIVDCPITSYIHDGYDFENLRLIKEFSGEVKFDFISVHYGGVRLPGTKATAPFPVVMNKLEFGQACDRMKMVQDIFQTPVGIENLALAWNRDSVFHQVEVINELMEKTNSYLLLDLHNLYCQASNFSIDLRKLVADFPKERVRQIHLSGGSVDSIFVNEEPQPTPFRRDTHIGEVPEPVFDSLAEYLQDAKDLQWVVIEKWPEQTNRNEAQNTFLKDYSRLVELVRGRSNFEKVDRLMMHDFEKIVSNVKPINSQKVISYLVGFPSNTILSADEKAFVSQIDPRSAEVAKILFKKWTVF